MRRFLGIWLAALLGLALAVLAFTVGIDPYGMIGSPSVSGVNADKVAAADRPRMTKAYMVERQDWATIVLGASNADVGIDPASAAWPAADRPVFNLAIDGGDALTELRFLQHALATRQPRLLMLGLTLEDAMTARPSGSKPSAAVLAEFGYEDRMRVTADGAANPAYRLARLQDTVFATFSLQALYDSVLTLLRQNDPGRTKQTLQGLNSAGNFARWVEGEGSYSLVMDKDHERTPKMLAWGADPLTTVAPVGDIVRLAHARGIPLIVFIMPSYVDQLEALQQSGLTPEFQRWKLEVARTIEQADPGKPAVPLWDFSGISGYTTEQLAPRGDRAHPLRWFWEPVHFRAALGDLMVRRMLDNGGPADLGALVTSASLPARFAAEADLLREWEATHPADVARVAAIVDEAAHAVCGTPVARCPRQGMRTSASR